jgi:hypothetical protein
VPASIANGLEMLAGARGEEEWVAKKNNIIKRKSTGLGGGLIEGLQEPVPYIRGKGLDLQCVCRVFGRRGLASRRWIDEFVKAA